MVIAADKVLYSLFSSGPTIFSITAGDKASGPVREMLGQQIQNALHRGSAGRCNSRSHIAPVVPWRAPTGAAAPPISWDGLLVLFQHLV